MLKLIYEDYLSVENEEGLEIVHIENDYDICDVKNELIDLLDYINLENSKNVKDSLIFSIRKDILKKKNLQTVEFDKLNKASLIKLIEVLIHDYRVLEYNYKTYKEE